MTDENWLKDKRKIWKELEKLSFFVFYAAFRYMGGINFKFNDC